MVFTGTAANPCYFGSDFYCNSITIQNDTTTGRGFRLNAVANLKGNVPLVVKKAGIIQSSATASVVFSGSAPTNNCYVTFLTDAAFNTAEHGMFDTSTSRGNVTFKFKPGANISITLEDGVYPHLQFITDSSTVYFSPTSVPTQSNSFGRVDALSLDSDAPIKPLTRIEQDLGKEFSFDGSLTLDMDVSPTASVVAHRGQLAADWGLSTVKFTPNGTSWYLPVNGDANFGPSGTAGLNTFNVKYYGLKIGKATNASHYAQIRANLILDCYSLEIEGGARLYGASLFTDINSSEIHTVKRPKVLGDWNYTQVAEGVYRSRGSTIRLPVSAGGTGIEYVTKNSVLYGQGHGAIGTLAMGTANQVLSVNAGATALVWAAAGGSGNAYDSIAVSGQTSLAASSGDDLTFVAAGGMTITTNAGTDTITFSSADTTTDTVDMGDGFKIRDDDDDDLIITENEYIQFIAATGALGTNLAGAGTTGDPYVMTITSPDTTTDTDTTYSATANGGIGLSGTAFSLDIDGMNDIGAPLVAADLMIVDDAAGGTNRKATMTRLQAYMQGALTFTTNTNTVDMGDGFKIVDSGADDEDVQEGEYLKFVTATGTLGTNLTGAGTSGDPFLMTLTSPNTDTDTVDMGSGFKIRDDDDDDLTVIEDKYLKFVAATGALGTDLSGAGTTGDPFLMTITSPNTDTVYTHPTSAGSKHIPSGGASGNFLKYDSSGTAIWATPSYIADTNLTTEEVQDIVGAMFTGNTETNTAVTYEDSDGTIDVVTTLDGAPLTTEAVQDIVGAMFGGNTETRIAATYEDSDGTIDLVVTDMTADTQPRTDEYIQDIVGAMFSGNTETNTAVTYDDSDGTIDVVTTLDGATLTTEAVQDIVGGMFSSNTETRITATYEDGDGTIDLVVDDMTTDANTQNIFTSTWVDSTADVLLRLTKSGASSGTQDLKLIAGANVSLTPSGTDMTIASTDTDTVYTHPSSAGDIHIPSGGSSGEFLRYSGVSGVAVWATPTYVAALTTEEVQDIVGGMVTGNTETNISVTYEDGDGTLDFVATDNNTTYSAGTLLDLSTTTFNVDLSEAAEETVAVGSDYFLFLDGGATGTAKKESLTDLVSAMAGANITSSSGILAGTPDTVYTHPSTAGNIHVPTGGSSGQFLKYSGLSGVASWATPDYVADTNLTTEEVQDIVGAMVSGNTETNIAVSYEDGDGTLDFVATDTQPRTDEYIQDIVGAMFSGNTETNTAVTYEDGDGTIDVVTTLDGAPLTTEAIQDIVGAMVSGNTETNISVTYQDGDGTIDFVSTDTDTVYTHPTTAGSIHLPSGGSSGQFLKYSGLSGVGSWATPDYVADTNLSTEEVQDIVGAMFTSNTETRISATYEDGDGTIDLVVDDMSTDANTQNEYATSWVDSTNDVLLRLTESGAGSGTQDIKLVAGSNISLTPDGTDMTIAATDTQPLTTEAVQDIVGAMVSGNTETNISVTYQDGDGTIDFAATDNDTVYTHPSSAGYVHIPSGGSSGQFLKYSGVSGVASWATPSYVADTNLSTEEVQDIVGAMFTGNTETNTAVTYEDGDGTIDVVTTLDGAPLTTEVVQDIVGAMFGSNTETRIGVTYDDSDGTIDLVVDDMTADTQLTTEAVQDIVGGMLTGNTETNISVTYQDGDGTIDFVATDSDTVYTHPTTAGNVHIPSGGSSNQFLKYSGLSGVATWATPDYVAALTTEEVQDIVGAMFSGNTETNTAVTYQDGDGTIDVVTTLDGAPLTTEAVQDIVGAMVSGNTETNIAVTYEDGDGTLDFVATDTQPLTTEAVQDIVGAMFSGNTETNTVVTYEDGDGTIDVVTTLDGAPLTTEAVQDIVGGMFSGNTETRIAATYEDGDGTIDLVVTDMTADTQLTTEAVQDIVGAMFTSNTETNTAVTYQDADGTIDVVTTLDGAPLTTEAVQDIVGAMVSGNTETNIAVTYQDGDGTIDFVSTDTDTVYTHPTTAGNIHLPSGGSSGQFLKYSGLSGVGSWATPDYVADTNLSTEEVQDIVGAMFSGNTETNTVVTYQDGDGTIDVVTTLDGAPLTTEAVQDIVGGMFSGNTETRIAATYEDGDGTIDLVVTDMTADTQPLTTEEVQDIVGGMFTGNTETRIAATYEDGDGTIDLVVTDMTTDTTYSAGAGLALSTTTFSIVDPITLDELDESSDATDDKILLWDESASAWKYMTLDNLQDSIDTTASGGAGEAFKTISVSGQDDVVADGATDTLTFGAGDNMTITTSAGSDIVSFASTQYTHPTTAGNKHVPTGGSSGQYLKYSGFSGIAAWTTPDEDIEDIAGAMFTGNTETLITATYQDADGTVDLVVDDDLSNYDNSSSGFITAPLTTEAVQDIVGAMFGSNTETRIAATYEDGDGTIDLVVDDMTADNNTTYSAGTNITLDTTTFNVDDAFLKNDASDTTTGTITAGGFTTAGSITLGGHAFDDIDIGSEFVDTDDHLMSAGAIKEKIEDYGYTTATGDIAGVTAGTGMSGGGTSGTVTLTNAGVTSIVAGTNVSISGATGAVTINSTDQYTGDITGVTAGDGLSGGGSSGGVTLALDDPINLSELTESNDATDDKILLWDESASAWKYMTLDNLQDSIDTTGGGGSGDMTGVDISVSTGLDISQSNTTSGDYSSTLTLDLTELTLGAGLDSTAQGLSLDLSELTDMTADVVGSADELILLDNGAERRKAINEIKLSEFDNDDFNSWTQFFYQRDSLGTNTYDLRIPVPAASTSGSNLFPMPKAGVVRAVSLSSTGTSLSGTATQTFRVRVNGATSGSDIEDFTLTADTMTNTNANNFNFTKTGLSMVVSAGDSLQLKRTAGSLSFGHVSGIVYVDFS